ncbi:transcriptional regulator with XRE-family HTH domain [Catenulispora sp. GP43]|uniref:helix-turn-helix domain-containing protein n=1 Tax=Catenulispora sp. GP43 TaxID=3156263 RepID=UPI003511998D
MSSFTNPSYERLRLRRFIRAERVARDLRLIDVATAMNWSESKAIRIESGAVKIGTNDLKALLAYYGIDDAQTVAEVLAMAKASRARPWWHEYLDVINPVFASLLGYESSATRLSIVHNSVAPGLLQTSEYAKAILLEFASKADVSRLTDLRMQRQAIFQREDPPQATFILGEAALRSQVGDATVLRNQLKLLLDRMDCEHTTIELVPFKVGAHPGMLGPFTIMSFDEGEEDVATFESPTGFTLIREQADVTNKYRHTFEGLREITLKGDEAAQFINRVIRDLDG